MSKMSFQLRRIPLHAVERLGGGQLAERGGVACRRLRGTHGEGLQ